MGGVFARGFLRCGHPVIPITRQVSISTTAAAWPDPELVLLAVAEKDLHRCLAAIPDNWQDKLGLLQNELLPHDWQRYAYADPTVISAWFEKKPGQDAKVLMPSPAFGPNAELLYRSLGSVGIPVRRLDTPDELLFELVRKNVYILTTNIAGLETGGNVAELWSEHRTLATQIAGEVISLQEKLTGRQFDRGKLITAMLEAFDGDPDHKCMGRSAPQRLQRALQLAQQHHLDVPTLTRISRL